MLGLIFFVDFYLLSKLSGILVVNDYFWSENL